MKLTRLLAAAIVSFGALAGCTAVAQSPSDSAPSGTVGGVGELPAVAAVDVTEGSAVPDSGSVVDPSDPTDPTNSSTPPSSSIDPSSTTTTVPPVLPVGEHTLGNRVLMIGDSVTASVAKRYGGEACKALVPLGWKLEVDAEVGRFIDFGKVVLDKRLDAGWDAVIIFLGNNYGEDQVVFESYMRAMLERLAPRPTIVINTSLFDPVQQQVNDAIAYDAAAYPNVSVIDWAKVTYDDQTLTGADGLHLTEAGRRALAYQLAAALGPAPLQPGECLDTNYHNDSAGSPYGPKGNSTKPKTTTTTIKPTATTTKTTSPTSTSTQNTTGTTTATTTPTATTQPTTSSALITIPTIPATTAAPTTAAPTTAAPTTAAPTTAPPTTAAPTTSTPAASTP